MKRTTIIAIVLLIVLISGAIFFLKDKKEDTMNAKAATTTTTEAVAPTKETPSTYYGIDVSHWNGNILEDINKLDDLSFGICKATQGINYVDPDFVRNWAVLHKKGLLRGAYHFYKTNDDPVQQARYYYQKVSAKSDKHQMTFIVDIEAGSVSGTTTKNSIEAGLLSFLKELEALSGMTPMVYTNYAFANEYLTNIKLAKYPLWLAEYSGNKSPAIPHVWKDAGYTIWQKTDTHDLNSTSVDYDEYNGVLSALNKFGDN